jgi:uncharacterized phage infection (PIP) family protein YhgE
MGDDNKLAEQLNKIKLLMPENSKLLEQYKKFSLENAGVLSIADIDRINNLENQVKAVNERILEIEIKKGIVNLSETLSEKANEIPEPWKTYVKNLLEIKNLKNKYTALITKRKSLPKGDPKIIELSKEIDNIRNAIQKKQKIYLDACEKITNLVNTPINNCSNSSQKVAKEIIERDYKYILYVPALCGELEQFFSELFPRA